MNPQQFLDLSDEAWDRELQERKRVVPNPLGPEQAKAQFDALATAALYSVFGRFAHHMRRQNGLSVQRMPPMPKPIADWIKAKVGQADGLVGHLGAQTYRQIANSFLAQLRQVQDYLLDKK